MERANEKTGIKRVNFSLIKVLFKPQDIKHFAHLSMNKLIQKNIPKLQSPTLKVGTNNFFRILVRKHD